MEAVEAVEAIDKQTWVTCTIVLFHAELCGFFNHLLFVIWAYTFGA